MIYLTAPGKPQIEARDLSPDAIEAASLLGYLTVTDGMTGVDLRESYGRPGNCRDVDLVARRVSPKFQPDAWAGTPRQRAKLTDEQIGRRESMAEEGLRLATREEDRAALRVARQLWRDERRRRSA
jgi:hypothetical protein